MPAWQLKSLLPGQGNNYGAEVRVGMDVCVGRGVRVGVMGVGVRVGVGVLVGVTGVDVRVGVGVRVMVAVGER